MPPQQAPAPNPIAQSDTIAANMVSEPKKPSSDDYFSKTMGNLNKATMDLEAQMNRMRTNLDRRTNMPFDPTLMQAAAGFLAPTKTGGFGESLGAAAGNAATQAEKDWVRNQETEKMRLELAQKGLALQQQVGARDLAAHSLQEMDNPAAGVTAGAAAPAAGQGSGQLGGQGSVQSGQPRSPASRRMTDRDIIRAEMLGNPEYLKSVKDRWEREQKTDQQALDTRKTQAAEDTVANTKFDVAPQGLNGFVVKDVSSKTKDVYDQIASEYAKDHDLNKLLRSYEDRLHWVLPPEMTRGADGNYPSAMSLNEREAQSAGIKAESEKSGQNNAEMANNLMTTARQSSDVIVMSKEATSIAKSAPEAFKLLGNKDSELRTYLDGQLAMVAKGIQTPWGSISIPVDIAQRAGLKDREIQALQKFAQIEAQFTLMNRRTWLQGQGAISNGENAVAAQLGPQMSDRPEVIQMKSQALERKAQFDEKSHEVYTTWKSQNRSKGFDSFLTSPQFKEVKNEYIQDMSAMKDANAKYFSYADKSNQKATAASPATASATKAPVSNAAPVSKAAPVSNTTPVSNATPDRATPAVTKPSDGKYKNPFAAERERRLKEAKP